MLYSLPSVLSSDRSGRVACVYLDESNFRISGGTAYKESHRIDPKERIDWHYDITALRGIIREVTNMKVNEEVILNVYGSNLDRGLVSQDLKLYSSRLFSYFRRRRQPEKQVDTTLVRDMVLDAFHLQEFKDTNVFVLVSGDNDMIPSVEYALQCKYTVHVFAWKGSVSDDYTQLAHKGRIELTLLDEFLVNLTMANFSVPMGKLRFPRNYIVRLNRAVNQLGDKLAEYFHRSRKLKLGY
ncbi:hypothetical protein FPCIR_5853 [Fusarium pseudocircinatum]|uniref:NYN domain-containing protein n=1 Tax=Fusarium pseudocircinatum TaxID=56676 RepID=A0A8H5UNH9_9HYPO|nr:hypothetical protein FPCIR_5853 [Fusarium pseudocircinatum]